uniref:diguanylate cyclase n=1 Tax=Rickettsia sp. TH2014 TaxID=1967503 RepID=UPI001C46BFB4
MTANVLLVSKDRERISPLEARLYKEYYTVYIAENSSQTIEHIAKYKIDVIILGIDLEEVDGIKICTRLKQNPSTTYIPVVMIAEKEDADIRIQAFNAGADELITYPIDIIVLLFRLTALSKTKKLIDELMIRNSSNIILGVAAMSMEEEADRSIAVIDDQGKTERISDILYNITKHVYKFTGDEDEIKASDKDIDIVLISSLLEHQDPLRVVSCIRSHKLYKDSIIVMLVDKVDELQVTQCMDIGINDFFLYNIEEVELVIRVKTLLQRKLYKDNLKRQLQEQVELSIKDGLTGIFNRHYFDVHAIQVVRETHGCKYSSNLLMCDLDDFKNVNDQHGHQAGDAVLKTFAEILKNNFYVTDLVARYGGEEFVILLGCVTLDQAEQLAERLRKKVEETEFIIPLTGDLLKKTVSIGVTEYKRGEPIEQFIARADKAMYMA